MSWKEQNCRALDREALDITQRPRQGKVLMAHGPPKATSGPCRLLWSPSSSICLTPTGLRAWEPEGKAQLLTTASCYKRLVQGKRQTDTSHIPLYTSPQIENPHRITGGYFLGTNLSLSGPSKIPSLLHPPLSLASLPHSSHPPLT